MSKGLQVFVPTMTRIDTTTSHSIRGYVDVCDAIREAEEKIQEVTNNWAEAIDEVLAENDAQALRKLIHEAYRTKAAES